ncbi:hypothetical protein ACLOJK_032926 [Asimina triloba]
MGFPFKNSKNLSAIVEPAIVPSRFTSVVLELPSGRADQASRKKIDATISHGEATTHGCRRRRAGEMTHTNWSRRFMRGERSQAMENEMASLSRHRKHSNQQPTTRQRRDSFGGQPQAGSSLSSPVSETMGPSRSPARWAPTTISIWKGGISTRSLRGRTKEKVERRAQFKPPPILRPTPTLGQLLKRGGDTLSGDDPPADHFFDLDVDCAKTLQSCGSKLMPLAEAVAADPPSSSTLFGWPVIDRDKAANEILWNGINTGLRLKKPIRSSSTPLLSAADSWVDDPTSLSLPLYKQLMSAMKARDLSLDVTGALMVYAKRSIPGLSRSSRKHSMRSVAPEFEQRELLEMEIEDLPSKSRSATASAGAAATTPTRFLFVLLMAANILRASEEFRAALERRIG